MKVLVAMSGGVDSTVAAALLVAEGHEVSGVTLKLWGGPSDTGCCSVEDVTDAALVADQLGIDHHVFNLTDAFERHVVDPYVADHLAGQTPNPCVECNRHLKFDALLAAARRLGFDRLATGHHARVGIEDGRPTLRRGTDRAKDQSYVLSILCAEQLASLAFPVGTLTKSAVREHAVSLGLRTAAKPDSQDLCFIDRRAGRAGFLGARATLTPGTLVEAATGRTVGEVPAVELVTVGQKRGLGLDEIGRRRVVIGVRPAEGVVLVASPDEAGIDHLSLVPGSTTWVDRPLHIGSAVLVQVRAHGQALAGVWRGESIDLETPEDPVAPGQIAALYDAADPDQVVGSARVAR